MVETLFARSPEAETQSSEAEGQAHPADEEAVHQRGPRRSAGFVLRRTGRRFLQDRGFGAASALALQSVLVLATSVVALLGAVAATAGHRLVGKVDAVLAPVLSPDVRHSVVAALDEATGTSHGWVVLGLGAAAALLAVVGYVASVRAAVNRAWQVGEGRLAWKLAGVQVLLGLATYALGAVAATLLVTSGPMAAPLVRAFGLEAGADELTVWSYAVWTLLAVVLIVLVALLHRATPNVRFGRTRWMTPGSFVTIVLWLAAGAGLAVFLAWYPSWSHTAGTVAAVGLTLVWLWVAHAALVLGAELDAELERGRELQGGREAEEQLQVRLRDDRAFSRAELREHRASERMREIRVAAVAHGNPDDRPFGRR